MFASFRFFACPRQIPARFSGIRGMPDKNDTYYNEKN